MHTWDKWWMLTLGARTDDNSVHAATASPTLNQNGQRTDVALRLDYDSNEDWKTYAYGQATVQRTGQRRDNNRVGIGGSLRLTEKLTGKLELSEGTGGFGGKAGAEYQIGDNKTAYLNYVLDPDRTDIVSRGGLGILTQGTRQRFSDNVSVFGEERLRHGGGYSGLTHAFGLDFVPFEFWKAGLGFETGKLSDPLAGDVERNAVSLTIGYAANGLTYSGKAEYRNDKITSTLVHSVRDTYLTTNTLGLKMNPDWRFIGRLNGSYSTSSQGDFYRGDYIEAVTGFAYRPVANDRLNALFKYTYFYDLPSPGQKSASALLADYAQQSHVLSADAAYDLSTWVTVGGKYAFRTGELRDNRTGGPWLDSVAQLVIGRIDVHVVKAWDVVGEYRILEASTAKDQRAGALVGVYRHINDNFKIGAGYNFTDFTDDLTNLNY